MTMGEVTLQDQKLINEFSKLNDALLSSNRRLSALRCEQESVRDAVAELELADDDERIDYLIGGSFVSVSVRQANEFLAQRNDQAELEISTLQAVVDGVAHKMASLKSILYAKFGKAINLEND